MEGLSRVHSGSAGNITCTDDVPGSSGLFSLSCIFDMNPSCLAIHSLKTAVDQIQDVMIVILMIFITEIIYFNGWHITRTKSPNSNIP